MINPLDLQMVGNRVLLRHIRDEAEDNRSIIIMRNSSNRAKTRPIGEVVKLPNYYTDADGNYHEVEISVGDRVGYFSKARLYEFRYEDEVYYLVRLEDIEFLVDK